MDCSLPGSSVHGILQARILEWVAILGPSSKAAAALSARAFSAARKLPFTSREREDSRSQWLSWGYLSGSHWVSQVPQKEKPATGAIEVTGVVLPPFQVPWEQMWASRHVGLLQALGHQR